MRNNGPARARAESIKSAGTPFDCESKSDHENATVASTKPGGNTYHNEDRKVKRKTTGPLHNMKYKAKLCKNWSKNGFCQYYEKCQFAHGQTELEKWARHRAKYQADLAAGIDSPHFGEAKSLNSEMGNQRKRRTSSLGQKPRAGSPPVRGNHTRESPTPIAQPSGVPIVDQKLTESSNSLTSNDPVLDGCQAQTPMNVNVEVHEDLPAARLTAPPMFKESAFKTIGSGQVLGAGSLQDEHTGSEHLQHSLRALDLGGTQPSTSMSLGPGEGVLAQRAVHARGEVRPIVHHSSQLAHDPQRAFQPLNQPMNTASHSFSPGSSSWSPVPGSPTPLDVDSTYSVMDQLFDSPTGFSLSTIRSAIFPESTSLLQGRPLQTPQFETVRVPLPPRPQSSAGSIIRGSTLFDS